MIVSSKKDELKPKNGSVEPEISKVEETLSWLNKTEEEEFLQLRPRALADYIGQQKIRKQLSLIIQSSQIRESLPEHILFYGQPGLGKTTLASLISKELGVNFKVISAPSLQRVGDLMAILLNLEPKTVLFIDEIHRLRATLEESLYTAMESFEVDLVMGKATTSKAIRVDIPPFTLVGATTQLGKISKPLKDRFGSVFQLEAYNPSEIRELIDRNSLILKLNLESEAKKLLSERCRGVPRITNNILKRLRDYQLVNNLKSLDIPKLSMLLEELGIFENGLINSDLLYMQSLARGASGIKTLSAILLEEVETLETVTEPYLLHLGLIDKSTDGRKLTPKGKKYLKEILGKNFEEY